MPAIRFDVAVYGIIYGNISRVTVESWQWRLLVSRHLDLHHQTSDLGDFNGLLGSACALEKGWDS